VCADPAPLAGVISALEGKMGYLEMAKLAAVAILMVVVLAVCGHYVYTYKHNQDVIAQQAEKIKGLQAEQDLEKKKADSFDAFMKKKPVIQRRVVQNEAQEDEAINSGDVSRVLDAFHRLQPGTVGNPPPNGGGSRAKPAPGAAAGS